MSRDTRQVIAIICCCVLVLIAMTVGFGIWASSEQDQFRDDQVACLDSGGIPIIINNNVDGCWREVP